MSTKIYKKNNKFSIANNLRLLRKYKEITLEQLANNVKITFDTFRNYEQNYITPQLDTLIKISNYFEISIDYLLLWDSTNYPHNIKLLSLAKKIDQMEQVHRFQLESTTNSFLKANKKNAPEIKTDKFEFDLTNNINKNIEFLRERKEITQSLIAKNLDINQSMVAHYENRSIPPADKLIKLSDLFNVSIHSLVTGNKLIFDIEDNYLEKTMYQADQLLSLEEHKMLIYLMETIIKTSPASS